MSIYNLKSVSFGATDLGGPATLTIESGGTEQPVYDGSANGSPTGFVVLNPHYSLTIEAPATGTAPALGAKGDVVGALISGATGLVTTASTVTIADATVLNVRKTHNHEGKSVLSLTLKAPLP